MSKQVTSSYEKSKPDRSSLLLQEPTQSIFAIAAFLVLTFAWSWLLGFSAIYAKPYTPVLSTILSIVSGFGPSIAALVTVSLFGGQNEVSAWLKNALNWRVGWPWYALAFFMPPLVMLLAQAVHWTLGGAIPTSPVVLTARTQAR